MPGASKKTSKSKIERELKNANLRKSDFRVFMRDLWAFEGLVPTDMQYLFADVLQKETARKVVFLGYRGFAKTMLLSAFDVWILYKDPTKQIGFWGSSEDSAKDSTKLMLDWITNVPWLQHLAPKEDQNQSALSFDVYGRNIFRGSSVEAYGITGSITGTRGDYICIDDPETSSNADSAKKRAHIERAIDEASYVIKDKGYIRALGTIHFPDSIYLRMMDKGYKVWIFPMAVPSAKTQQQCWQYYPKAIQNKIKELDGDTPGSAEGTPLDRFSAEEIELKRQNGLLSFERQCLCNPFQSQYAAKPLDLSKCPVFDASSDRLPIRFSHSQHKDYLDERAMDNSSARLSDKLYFPYGWDEKETPYEYKVTVVDPAGKGDDEVAVLTLGVANGYVVLLSCYGMAGGSREENLARILDTALRYKVNLVSVEDNFGMGMFATLLRAKFLQDYARFGYEAAKLPIDTHRNTKKKKDRIQNNLDPIINFGRLILTPTALEEDFESAKEHEIESGAYYRLTYQISYFNTLDSELEKDDRIDALSDGCSILSPYLGSLPETKAQTYEDRLIQLAFEAREEDLRPEELMTPREELTTDARFMMQSRQHFL